MVSKVCTICKEEKSVTDFFPKRGKYEACCKTCKGKNRQIRSKRRSRSEPKASDNPWAAPMEDQPDPPHIEPEQDSNFWDMKYGKSLSREEQREIRYNLLALMTALHDAKLGA